MLYRFSKFSIQFVFSSDYTGIGVNLKERRRSQS